MSMDPLMNRGRFGVFLYEILSGSLSIFLFIFSAIPLEVPLFRIDVHFSHFIVPMIYKLKRRQQKNTAR